MSENKQCTLRVFSAEITSGNRTDQRQREYIAFTSDNHTDQWQREYIAFTSDNHTDQRQREYIAFTSDNHTDLRQREYIAFTSDNHTDQWQREYIAFTSDTRFLSLATTTTKRLSDRYTVRCNRADLAVGVSSYSDIEPWALHGLTHATCHSDWCQRAGYKPLCLRCIR